MHFKKLSAAEHEALAWFDVSLSSGATLLRAMVKRMIAQASTPASFTSSQWRAGRP